MAEGGQTAAVGFEDLIVALNRSVLEIITHQPPVHCGQSEESVEMVAGNSS